MNRHRKGQNGWQHKIDPAFDELIKIYRHFLDICRLPRNSGYVALEDETLKAVKKDDFPSLAGMYDSGFDLASPADLKIPEYVETLQYISTLTLKNIYESVPELIKALPPKSKAYYKKRFNIGMSEEEAKALYEGKFQEELQRIFEDQIMDLQALLFHAGTMGYLDPGIDSKSDKEDVKKALPVALATVYDTVSRLTHKKPIRELLKEAQGDNDAALFKAVQIDKMILDLEWARKRIRKAMLSGDSKFFNKLGNAIKKAPLDHDREYGELQLVLTMFWNMGLKRLSNDELMEVLTAGGLRVPANKDTFARLKNRILKE
ncbi:MAG: hypothetical protein NUW09_00890 [Deltaproteobacteria bacterium]|nr:hypothetical protein [Deltaproteobacteria bacterium]